MGNIYRMYLEDPGTGFAGRMLVGQREGKGLRAAPRFEAWPTWVAGGIFPMRGKTRIDNGLGMSRERSSLSFVCGLVGLEHP